MCVTYSYLGNKLSAVTDIEGQFAFKLVNPDDQLEVTYVGYERVRTSITGTEFTITLVEQEDLPQVDFTSDPGIKTTTGLPIPLREVEP